MSSGSSPATAIARLPATARQRGGRLVRRPATRRSRMPVRLHDPLVGRVDQRSRSALVRTRSGAYMPQPVMRTLRIGCVHRLHLDERLLGLDERAALGGDPDDPAGDVALDLVEQLHRLDEPDHLADRHLAPDRDVRRRAGRGRRVEEAGEGADDGVEAASAASADARRRAAPVRDGAGAAGAPTRATATARCRRATGGQRRRLAQHHGRAAGLDLELGQVGSLEQASEPVDRARSARRRHRPARRLVAGSRSGPSVTRPSAAGRGPCSGRRSRTQLTIADPDARRAAPRAACSRGPPPAGSGSTRLSVGGTQPSRMR